MWQYNITLLIFFVILLSVTNVQAEKKVYRVAVDSDGIQRVNIVGGEYYFDPDYIVVQVNIPVELSFRKMPGITPHNIIISAPEAGIDFNENMSGETKTVTFTPVKTGKYPVYCDKKFLFFKNHRKKGMEGTLEVVE